MDSLGLVECRTIASGADLADGMVKSAQVELVRASTICSGRFLIYVSGDRQAVENAVRFAQDSGRKLSGAFVISNISPQLVQALKKADPAQPGDALGVVESRAVAVGVAAADKAVKRSAVRLSRLVTGQGITGKLYFIVSGDVASVREAVEAATEFLEDALVDAVVIPRPDQSVLGALTGAGRPA